jgi:hypothetical protein
MKEQVAQFKADVKRKVGSLARFALLTNVEQYDLRKHLARIENNKGIYLTKFNSDKELKKLYSQLNKLKEWKKN